MTTKTDHALQRTALAVAELGRVNRLNLSLMKRTLLLLLALCSAVCAAGNPGWETISSEPARIAVPKGWRSFDGIKRTMPLFRQGDGIDLPMVDETGDALQIGISVERFPAAKESTETIAKELAKGSTKDPRLERTEQESVEAIKLTDGTEATLLTMELIKSGSRRSLYMKLIGKDATGQIWIVSGFIVGGKESKWPTPNSMLCAWLRAHVVSLTLTGKEVDPKGLEAAYQVREGGR